MCTLCIIVRQANIFLDVTICYKTLYYTISRWQILLCWLPASILITWLTWNFSNGSIAAIPTFLCWSWLCTHGVLIISIAIAYVECGRGKQNLPHLVHMNECVSLMYTNWYDCMWKLNFAPGSSADYILQPGIWWKCGKPTFSFTGKITQCCNKRKRYRIGRRVGLIIRF